MTSKSKKSTTPYDRVFEQYLTDHGIYLNNRVKKLENWEEINKRLAKPRLSLSPSKFPNTAFEDFQVSDAEAKDEDDVMIDVILFISGLPQNTHFSVRNTIFGNLNPLTDGTIAPAQPDFYYSAHPEQLNR